MTSDLSGSWFGSPADADASTERSNDQGFGPLLPPQPPAPHARRSDPLLPQARLKPLDDNLRHEIDGWRKERAATTPDLDLWSGIKKALDRE